MFVGEPSDTTTLHDFALHDFALHDFTLSTTELHQIMFISHIFFNTMRPRLSDFGTKMRPLQCLWSSMTQE